MINRDKNNILKNRLKHLEEYSRTINIKTRRSWQISKKQESLEPLDC
jgi:hypothetical protein